MKNDFLTKENHEKEKLENSYFVVSFVKSGPPWGMTFHKLMNFEDVGKMLEYIKYEVVMEAVADELDFDYEEVTRANFEGLLEDYINDNEPGEYEEIAIRFWKEIDEIIESPKEEQVEKLLSYMERFNKDFVAPSWHDFEIIKPEDSLVDFWEEFFCLSLESEQDKEELEMVKKALSENNPDLLDEAINRHNGEYEG